MTSHDHQSRIIGFAIQPAQSLSELDTRGLQDDLISLLLSLSYHPEHVSKVILDLRYVASEYTSLVAKALDIVLLVLVDFEESVSHSQADTLVQSFETTFHDLLTLHLARYEFGIVPLRKEDADRFRCPFDIASSVEITRNITNSQPFAMTTFQGNSPMTRVVDMLLRETGQCMLSVVLEPHRLDEAEIRELRAFGYKNPVVPARQPDEELLEIIQQLRQIHESMHILFRSTIRLVSDKPVSQYLVNLVGSEISGQRDFFHFRHTNVAAEAESVKSLRPTYTHHDQVANLHLPPILTELVYLFKPEEAVSAFRLPTQRISVAQEKAFKTYPLPVRLLPNEGLKLGVGSHPSYKEELPVFIGPGDRARHMYIVGKTGTGKSYLLLNMIKQDITDQGLCVIDPHGDLVEAIFPLIPTNRMDDVYYFDPADPEYALGFNFLETPTGADDAEKDYVIQEVISMLLRLVDYEQTIFGPQAQELTRFGCMTLMDLPEAGTLVDVPRLFTDKEWRTSVLQQVKSNIVRQWWEKNYGGRADFHKSEVLGYFTSKFLPMVTAPQVRNILGQPKSALDFGQIMNEGKILLVNVSSGRLGRINSHFLGSLVVSKLLWTALRRARDPVESRKQFFLYVDEFQNFITDSFEQILSEARKYGLSLTVAHQYIDQMRAMGKMGDKILRAVFGNVGTIVSFRVDDGAYIAEQLGGPAEASSLKNLANRYAVATVQVDGVPSTPFTMKTVDWVPPETEKIKVGQKIKDKARKRGRPVSEVASEIDARFGAKDAGSARSV